MVWHDKVVEKAEMILYYAAQLEEEVYLARANAWKSVKAREILLDLELEIGKIKRFLY